MVSIENLSTNEIEQQFVKTFVISQIRNRVIYELTSSKKRRSFFSRLSYKPILLLKAEFMIKVPQLRVEQEISEITSMLIARGAKNKCYVMSYIQEIDRTIFPLKEGVQACVNCSMETVLVCNEKLAFFQSEQVLGSPPRFLLHKKLKFC